MRQFAANHFDTTITSIAALAPPSGAQGATGGPSPADAPDAQDIINRSLQAARRHLDLDVAYLSQFEGDETVFRYVDAPGLEDLVAVGGRRSLDDMYCRHILEGRLPELIPDTAAEPLAASMPVTAAVPVGAHLSVPVRLGDGELYGMFCCLGASSDPTLNERDLNVMRCFADMAAMEVDRSRLAEAEQRGRQERIEALIAHQSLDIVYQPIWDITAKRAIGFESLSRFRADIARSPDHWFHEAQLVGLGTELELLAASKALDGLDRLPAHAYLTVNCSPLVAADPRLHELLRSRPLDRLVLEITEHELIDDGAALALLLEPLRSEGLRLAIDDAGSGYSGLQQILEVKPDIIKLDRFFVRSIESDPSRQAMAGALAAFATSVACSIIAEGVETREELGTLDGLGFHHIQGFLLGRPAAIGDIAAMG